MVVAKLRTSRTVEMLNHPGESEIDSCVATTLIGFLIALGLECVEQDYLQGLNVPTNASLV